MGSSWDPAGAAQDMAPMLLLLLLPSCLPSPSLPSPSLLVGPGRLEGRLYGGINFTVTVPGGEGGKVYWEPSIEYITPLEGEDYGGKTGEKDFLSFHKKKEQFSLHICT